MPGFRTRVWAPKVALIFRIITQRSKGINEQSCFIESLYSNNEESKVERSWANWKADQIAWEVINKDASRVSQAQRRQGWIWACLETLMPGITKT